MRQPRRKYVALRERLRELIKVLAPFSPKMPMHIPINEMTLLLDYIDNLEEINYSAWETHGEKTL
jgi:hypothetical protein